MKDNNIKTRKELQTKASGAYAVANKLGILDDLFGEKTQWTKENCADLAAKCKYRSDFIRQYPAAYAAARKHGWLDDITKHMPKQKGYVLISNHNYIVYVYEDIENNAAYVGLTNNIKRRDWEHRFPDNRYGYDKLGLWCIEHDIPVPQPKILENNLTAKEAGEKEEEYWYKYRDEGWTMINSEKALGSIGGIKRKWTEKSIKQFVKDNNIKTRSELRTKASGAYGTALKLGIINDLFGEKKMGKPITKWTEEFIRQFVKDNNIKTRIDFLTKANGAYRAARRLDILDELFPKNH